MKKIILSAIMLIGLASVSQAQNISKNALGLRLGGNNGFGGEISYQRALSSNNRLELDLGWRGSNDDDVDALKLTGIYQWVWNIEGGFNWYAGVGGGLGTWNNNNYNNGKNNYDEDGFFVFVAGDLGIEYDFKEAPIQISLDLRPEIGFNNYNDDSLGLDLGLGIRYRF